EPDRAAGSVERRHAVMARRTRGAVGKRAAGSAERDVVEAARQRQHDIAVLIGHRYQIAIVAAASRCPPCAPTVMVMAAIAIAGVRSVRGEQSQRRGCHHSRTAQCSTAFEKRASGGLVPFPTILCGVFHFGSVLSGWTGAPGLKPGAARRLK